MAGRVRREASVAEADCLSVAAACADIVGMVLQPQCWFGRSNHDDDQNHEN